MKIRLALLDNDVICLQKLCDVFSTKFSDKLELYAFTEFDSAMSCIHSTEIDVFLARTSFQVDVENLPKRIGFAYLVDSRDIESYEGQRTICRFQKADDIYKLILDIYSTCSTSIVNKRFSDSKTTTICFSSPCSGSGSSTMAISCATRLTALGKKVLYLDLQKFPTVDAFFGRGNTNFSDIIFALKSKKVNLAMKLQSCVLQSESGVFYFSQISNPLDILEITSEERDRLILALQELGVYDTIVIDYDYSLSKDDLSFIANADAIIYTCDGTENSVMKLSSCHQALEILEGSYGITLRDKTYILYNKFSSKIGQRLEVNDWKELGGVQRFEHADNSMVVNSVISKVVFDALANIGG